MPVMRRVLLGIAWLVTLAGAFVAGALVHKYRAAIRARLQALQGSPVIQTNLYNLTVQKLAVPAEGRDGALDVLGDGLLLVNRRGRSWFVTPERALQALPLRVPINAEEFEADAFNRHTTDQDRFSVKDILVQQRGPTVRVLAAHMYWHSGRRCNTLRVSMAETAMDSLRGGQVGAGRWRTLFESAPCRELIPSGDERTRHVTLGAGGRLAMPTENQVLVSVGEFSAEYVAGDTSSAAADSYGKTILIDVASGATTEFTRGHRNQQGLAAGPDGRIWGTEHGSRGGDELNLLVRGRHYGAPHVTYGTQYEMMVWPRSTTQGRHEGYEKPLFAWVPSIATSQLLVLRGTAFPWWSGDLLVGTLASQSLFRVRVEDDRVIFVEPIAVGHRVRDLVETPQGSIVLKTDDDFLVYLDNADQASASALDPVTRGALIAGQCRSCHTLEQGGRPGLGPNLWGVVDARVASTAGFPYSDALRRVGGHWTAARLRAFIANPQAFAPGTRMQTTATYTDKELDDLIAYLQTLR